MERMKPRVSTWLSGCQPIHVGVQVSGEARIREFCQHLEATYPELTT
jgi:hypothetical protein